MNGNSCGKPSRSRMAPEKIKPLDFVVGTDDQPRRTCNLVPNPQNFGHSRDGRERREKKKRNKRFDPRQNTGDQVPTREPHTPPRARPLVSGLANQGIGVWGNRRGVLEGRGREGKGRGGLGGAGNGADPLTFLHDPHAPGGPSDQPTAERPPPALDTADMINCRER